MSIQSKSATTPIILGIDPGYDRLGWAIAQRDGAAWKKVHLGCIQTPKDADIFDRYMLLEQDLGEIIDQYQPTEAALENLVFAVNKKTAMQVSEARGVVIATLVRSKLPISQYAPNQIKLAVTGHGHADKKAVEKMIRMEFRLKDKKVLDDAIDALAVVLTHHLLSRNRLYYA